MKKKILISLLVATVLALLAALVGCKGLFGGLFGGGEGGSKDKVDMSQVKVVYSPFDGAKTYPYTGVAITIDRDIMINTPDNSRRVGNEYFEFSYSNNVNAGTATVTITATENNEYYFGSADFHFTIEKGAVIVLDAETLIEELKGDNVYQITVGGNVDLGEEELTVKEGVKLIIATASSNSSGYQRSFTVGGKLINNGEIELMGTMSYFGEINFFNNGEIVNNGTFTAGSRVEIFNAGTFTNNGTFTMTGSSYKIYTNDTDIENVFDSNGNRVELIYRHRIEEENIQLTTPYVVYSTNPNQNKLSYKITYNGASRYVMQTAEYRNYDRAGTAYIDITVGRTDDFFYGSITVAYEIKKASVAVSSVSELHEYAATGNYGTFTAGSFTVEKGETLTVPEGTQLHASILYLQGTLVNYGKVAVPGEAGSGAVFNGYIFFNYTEGGEGKLENYGTVEADRFSLYKGASVVNRGVITVNMASLQSPFTNEEGAEFTVNGNVNFYHRYINKGVFSAAPTDYVMIEPLSGGTNAIVNSGSMRIEGDIVCRNMNEFTNSGTIENTGTVWTYIELPTDFKNVVVKRQITAEDIAFVDASPTYDGTAKPAALAESTGLKAGQYRIEYAYEGEQATSTAPVNAGKMKLTIRVTNEKTMYFCSLSNQDERGILRDIPYEILRAERGVSTAQDLYDYANNSNYKRLYLENDIVFSSAKTSSKLTTYSFTVAAGVVLDTNEHTLTLEYISNESPYLYNHGTIFNSKIGEYPVNYTPSFGDCGIILKKANLSNYGTIINNNLFYTDKNSRLYDREGGKIENHGIMYLTGLLTGSSELVNSGKIYERENLSDIGKDKSRVALEYWEVDYNGQEHFPEAYLYDREEKPVDLTNTGRFTVEYINFVENRLCGVRISAIDEFDKQFYGFYTATVNVKKSAAKVRDIDALIAATQDSNYIGYELTQSFALNKNVTLPASTFLDLGTYDFSYSSAYTVDLTSGAELRVSVDTMDKFLKYVYVADKITFVGDIADEGPTSITFNASVMGKISDVTPFNKLYERTTIDLNGHRVGGQLSILNQYNPHINTTRYYVMNIVDTSEGKTGQLGTAGTKHGLSVGAPTAMYLNLDGVKVGGLELYYSVYLTARNSSFTTEAASGNTRAAYYCANSSNNNVQAVFEKCTFNGAVGAYVKYAKHIFRDCTITATGEYSKTGDWGSAILIDSNYARVGIDRGNFSSKNGYCVEINNVSEVNRANNEITKRTNLGSDAGSDESGRWSCGQVGKVNNATYSIVDTLSGFGMIV